MDLSKKTVSEQAMHAEWTEVQAAQENPRMFKPLYERYYEPIFLFIYRRSNDEQLSADLCSQVFLKALQKIGSYQFRGVPFSAWLYRIATNEVTQHFRKTSKKRVVSIHRNQLDNLVEEDFGIDYSSFRTQMLDALDELNEKDLSLIEMRFFEQRPFKEISEILEMTESNAKVRTYRILGRLKKKIQDQTGGQALK